MVSRDKIHQAESYYRFDSLILADALSLFHYFFSRSLFSLFFSLSLCSFLLLYLVLKGVWPSVSCLSLLAPPLFISPLLYLFQSSILFPSSLFHLMSICFPFFYSHPFSQHLVYRLSKWHIDV